MCMNCISQGIVAAAFMAVFATLFFSGVWTQYKDPMLVADQKTALLFLQYAAAFFFFGLSKMLVHKMMAMHPGKAKK